MTRGRRGRADGAGAVGWRASGAALAVLSVAALVLGGALVASRAAAMLSSAAERSADGDLRLTAAPLWRELWPGETARWIIGASLARAPSSTLELELRSAGEMVAIGGLTVSIVSCSGRFDPPQREGAEPNCSGRASTVLAERELRLVADERSSLRYSLDGLQRGSPRSLLISLGVPATARPADVANRSARIGVGLFAAGEHPPSAPRPGDPPGPDEPLALTGADVAALTVLTLGAIRLAAGWMLLRAGRAPRAERIGGGA